MPAAPSEASTVKQQQRHHQLPHQHNPHRTAIGGTGTQHTTPSVQCYQSKTSSTSPPCVHNTLSRNSPRSVTSNLTIVCKVYVQNIGWGTQVLVTSAFFQRKKNGPNIFILCRSQTKIKAINILVPFSCQTGKLWYNS